MGEVERLDGPKLVLLDLRLEHQGDHEEGRDQQTEEGVQDGRRPGGATRQTVVPILYGEADGQVSGMIQRGLCQEKKVVIICKR